MNSQNSTQVAERKGTSERLRPGNARLNELWAHFHAMRDVACRNALVEAYMPLVRREARKLCLALSRSVTPAELESAGALGLIDAIDAFEPAQGFRFVTFCTPRVRGAMLDELRILDWVPRARRAKFNRIDRAVGRFEQRVGRAPDEAELALEAGVSEAELRRLLRDKMRTILSIDEVRDDTAKAALEDRRDPGPVGHMQRKEITQLVRNKLSETERTLVILHYYEHLTLLEIAWVMGLSEGRICQMLDEVIRKMRELLE